MSACHLTFATRGRKPIAPGETCPVRFRRDFVPRTTRVLYPGAHAVQVRVNGVTVGEKAFELTA